jgi:hypothetical protein
MRVAMVSWILLISGCAATPKATPNAWCLDCGEQTIATLSRLDIVNSWNRTCNDAFLATGSKSYPCDFVEYELAIRCPKARCRVEGRTVIALEAGELVVDVEFQPRSRGPARTIRLGPYQIRDPRVTATCRSITQGYEVAAVLDLDRRPNGPVNPYTPRVRRPGGTECRSTPAWFECDVPRESTGPVPLEVQLAPSLAWVPVSCAPYVP